MRTDRGLTEAQERHDFGFEDHWDDPANPDLHPPRRPVLAAETDDKGDPPPLMRCGRREVVPGTTRRRPCSQWAADGVCPDHGRVW